MYTIRKLVCVGAVLAVGIVAAAPTAALAQDLSPQQPTPQPAGVVSAQPLASDSFPTLAADQLDQLLGAIALYPDPLIAQILPASTYPIDIVRAARFIRSGGATDQIDQQDWDPSVRAVAHYPSIIQMMDDSIAWTQQLGQAFIAQPDDVMQSVQRLRARAQNVGNLASNAQQDVVVDDEAIRILPASPDVIYIPTYQPSVVYYQPAPLYTSYVSYSYGYPLGIWLDIDCDWRHHWFYRPGWSWNHWNDYYFVDHNRFLRPRFDRGFRPGVPPPGLWHRDDHRPFTFPGRRLTRPSDFDHFRGRDDRVNHRPTQTPVPRPGNIDRGWPAGPRQNPADHTRNNLQGGRPTTTLAPGLIPQVNRASAQQPEFRPSPTPAPTGMRALPTGPARASLVPRTFTVPPSRTIAPQPAHISPPPVRIAAPPARPATPAYVRPQQQSQGDNTQRNLNRGHR